MKKLLTALIAFIALGLSVLRADDINFTKISTEQGLSHYTALSLYEDEIGTIWIATPMGLSRCMGSKISVYANDMKDSSSLSCNQVIKVTGNWDGLVYILTKQSFEVLDLRLDKIVSCLPLGGGFNISDIFYQEGLYACCNGTGIMRWNDVEKQFEDIVHMEDVSGFRSIFVDASHHFWIATSNTLYRIDSGLSAETAVQENIYVHNIYQDREGRILVSTLNDGIYVFTTEGELVKNISVREGLISNFVRTICQDPAGKYWVGTEKGLNILSADFKVESLYVADGKEGSISNSSIYDILCDSRGNIWTSTYFGGVNLYNPSQKDYHKLDAAPDSRGLSSSLVSCIMEGDEGDVWIGTVDGGLTRYNSLTHSFAWFRQSYARNSICGDNVKCLYYDRDGKILWIGTHLKGFSRLDTRTLRFRNYTMPDASKFPVANVVSAIIPYNDQLILTTYRGVFLFYPESGRFEKLLNLSYIRSAFKDSRSGLWMGTTSGQLFYYNLEEGNLKSYGQTLLDQNNGKMSIIYDMTEDGNGDIWMASFRGGLKKYDVSTGKFTTMNTLNSNIPTDNILAVNYCGDNKIIATIQDGYIIYDLQKRHLDVQNKNSGVPVDYIMENALYCSKEDNKIYIGTNDGLLYFHGFDPDTSHMSVPVIFSRFFVNGEEVRPGDDSGILKESMMYVDEVVLNSHQNSFAVEFFQPDHHRYREQQLMYCLDADHREWQKLLPGETILRFYNQSPGKFRILVKDPSNTDGDIMETSLVVHVKPPFYRTAGAFIIYFLLLSFLLAGIIYAWSRRLKEEERHRYNEKKLHYEKALALSKQQAKLQFFFAISHEFSTPLTIIMGQVELLLMKYDFIPSVKSKLDNVYKNAAQLHDLLLELLEFRKHEMGRMELKVAEYDICSIATDSFQLYKEYSDSRGIGFNLILHPEHIMIWCDKKQIYKVLNNLLSNAFKYTETGGQVTLSVQLLDNEICIQVSDNGCGMDSEDVQRIFSEFYQGKKATDRPGVGLGLHLVKNIIELHKGRVEVKSELNKGTSFFVHLKLGNGHFSLDELSRTPICDASSVQDKKWTPSPADAEGKELRTNAMIPDTRPAGDEASQIPECTLLIVEDNNALREMLANIFSQYYKVISAVDGKDGWNKLMQSEIDIVVSDIIMPNMTGTELCKKIKDNIETCHIPVVLLSVRADIQNCIDGFNAQADDYITKPFSLRLLLSRCTNLLNNRKLMQKKFQQSPNADVKVLASNDLDKDFAERLVSIIEKNIDNSDLNIAYIQQEMFVSRTTLFQKIKAITGQTPKEFISNIRLKKAAVLLLTRPDMSISAVSDAVGFGSSKYFSRMFKETYHIRPLDYRNGKTKASGK